MRTPQPSSLLARCAGLATIALSLGAASTSRVPLWVVVVGGVLFSLVLTLLVIPAVYTYISSRHKGHKTVITD